MKITETKALHMHGVAEYMYKHAEEYDLDKDEMYLLGWVHDIGYIYGKDGHEYKGAELLGLDSYYGSIVRYHGYTPSQYIEEFGILESDIPNELILLWDADMMIDHDGKEVGYDKRLNGIIERYGKDSRPYKVCLEIIKFLLNRKKV